jgi:hypothetical protein
MAVKDNEVIALKYLLTARVIGSHGGGISVTRKSVGIGIAGKHMKGRLPHVPSALTIRETLLPDRKA